MFQGTVGQWLGPSIYGNGYNFNNGYDLHQRGANSMANRITGMAAGQRSDVMAGNMFSSDGQGGKSPMLKRLYGELPGQQDRFGGLYGFGTLGGAMARDDEHGRINFGHRRFNNQRLGDRGGRPGMVQDALNGGGIR